jgi:soluble lytic murein transglycosylase-like protein
MRYARVILKESNRYGIDPNIVVAIIAQESMFRAVSTRRQVIDRQAGLIYEYFDLGLMQVNIGTARGYGFDIDRLLVDDEYQIRAGIRVLADKIKICETLYPENPWGCYHSTTFKYHSAYVTNVRRWL